VIGDPDPPLRRAPAHGVETRAEGTGRTACLDGPFGQRDGGPSTLIDSATIFIPAAERREFWTVDYQGRRPTGRPGVERLR
jgi:hypothetical protein